MPPVPLSDELKAALDVDPTPGGVKYIIATQVRPRAQLTEGARPAPRAQPLPATR